MAEIQVQQVLEEAVRLHQSGLLDQAIARFEKVESEISPTDLQASVTQFSEAEFLSKMSRVLSQPQPTSRPSLSEPPVSCASES